MTLYLNRRRDKASSGWSNPKSKQKLIEEQGTICNKCKNTLPAKKLQLDHIRAISLGGEQFNIKNHQLLCIKCHINKSQRDRKLVNALKYLKIIKTSGQTDFTLEEINYYCEVLNKVFDEEKRRQ